MNTNKEICYLCKLSLPKQQSYYEAHGVTVCLTCYRNERRCKKCKFPSKMIQNIAGLGGICEFCMPEVNQPTGMICYLCKKNIGPWMSHYEGHHHFVCQSCFQDALIRCFLCRFPQGKNIPGLGGVCKFCNLKVINHETNLSNFLEPLQVFLKKYHHFVSLDINIQWIDWRIILGMQKKETPEHKIQFFDELIHYCLPVFYLKNQFYIIKSIPQEWFMASMAGQLVASHICKMYGLSHLNQEGPFYQLARGWVHWISCKIAKTLKYQTVWKRLTRSLNQQLLGDFPKFLAMSEYRSTQEIIDFAHNNLEKYAQKYL